MNISPARISPNADFTRNRAAEIEKLRRLLPGIHNSRQAILPFGISAIDRCLPQGGLASGALHEIVPDIGGTPAAFGFIVAMLATFLTCKAREVGHAQLRSAAENKAYLGVHDRSLTYPFFFITPAYALHEYGHLSSHGLSALGLDPDRLILVETADRRETLWTLEEALHSGAPGAVVGMIDKLDLKCSQRLHLAATESGLPLFLLRSAAPSPPSLACGAGWEVGSAAMTRWRIGTAEAARDRFGLFVHPRWHLRLERCRNGRPGQWVVEYDHVAHRFSLAAALADPALAHGANESPRRKTYRA